MFGQVRSGCLISPGVPLTIGYFSGTQKRKEKVQNAGQSSKFQNVHA